MVRLHLKLEHSPAFWVRNQNVNAFRIAERHICDVSDAYLTLQEWV
jgi:hypothetical protein